MRGWRGKNGDTNWHALGGVWTSRGLIRGLGRPYPQGEKLFTIKTNNQKSNKKKQASQNRYCATLGVRKFSVKYRKITRWRQKNKILRRLKSRFFNPTPFPPVSSRTNLINIGSIRSLFFPPARPTPFFKKLSTVFRSYPQVFP